MLSSCLRESSASVAQVEVASRCCRSSSRPCTSNAEGVVHKVLDEVEVARTTQRLLVGHKFEILLDRTTGDELGIDVREASPHLVTNIRPGLVADWNRKHPETLVTTGDYIVRVNGKSHDICTECVNHRGVLRLELLRPVLRDFEEAQRRAESSFQYTPEDIASNEYLLSSPPFLRQDTLTEAIAHADKVTSGELNGSDQNVGFFEQIRVTCVPESAAMDVQSIRHQEIGHGGKIKEGFSPQSSWRKRKESSSRNDSHLQKIDNKLMGEDTRQWQKLEEIIMPGDFRLIKGSFLVMLQQQGQPIRRFQDLPYDAFWDPREALRHVRESAAPRPSDGSAPSADKAPDFLHALSYRWFSKEHPDPEGFHLRLVAHVAALAMRAREEIGVQPDIGIFWDFACLPQEPRNREDHQRYAEGVHSSAALFAHRSCRVWSQPMVPPCSPPEDSTGGSDGKTFALPPRNYSESGWCFFEVVASNLGRPGPRRLDLATIPRLPRQKTSSAAGSIAEISSWKELQARHSKSWQPPMSPDMFSAEIEHCAFARSSDAALVSAVYNDAFAFTAASREATDFSFLSWGPLEIGGLSKTLPHFRFSIELVLDGNPMGDTGAEMLADALAAMTWLRKLRLVFCSIGEIGAAAIAAVMTMEHRCEVLDMSFNHLADAGTEALAASLAWLPLRELRLQACGLCDRGAGSIAALITQAPAISQLYLNQNTLSAAARDRLEAVWASHATSDTGAVKSALKLVL